MADFAAWKASPMRISGGMEDSHIMGHGKLLLGNMFIEAQVPNDGPPTPATPPFAYPSGYAYSGDGEIRDDTVTPSGTGQLPFNSDKLSAVLCRKLGELKAPATIRPPPGLPLDEAVKVDISADWEVPPPPVPEPGFERVKQGLAQASNGSIGHPLHCAEACQYYRRKGGCRDGAGCSKCHQCFWQRSAPAKDWSPHQMEFDGLYAAIAEGLPARVVIMSSAPGLEGNSCCLPSSEGSRGHPYSCASPCKYARRKIGCRDGANCPNCHHCQWRRDGVSEDSSPSVNEATRLTKVEVTPVVTKAFSDTIHLKLEQLCLQTKGQEAEASGSTTTATSGEDSVLGAVSSISPPLFGEDVPTVGSIGHPFSCSSACKYHSKPKGCKDGRCCVRCHLCSWRRYHQSSAEADGLMISL